MRFLLPFFTFLLAILSIRSFTREDVGLRLSYLGASLVIGIIIVVSTEVLSFFQALTQSALLVVWGACLLVGVFLLVKRRGYRTQISWSVFENRWLNFASLLIPLGLLIATFTIAVVAPPNNTDGMVYHMSRVAHWAQQRSVAHFATSTLRELYLNPLAEYGILHTYLLAGSDRFAHLIQWFSYLTAGVAVSLIAQQLGASKKGQYFAGVFALSIPQAILQSTFIQNDLTFSAFALIAVYIILRFVHEGERRWLTLAGAAVSLSVLVKSTSFIVLAPFMLWLAYKFLHRWKKSYLLASLTAALIAIALVFPFYLRNYQAFGSLLGPTSETSLYRNDRFNLKVLTSNSIRNLAINLTYTAGINSAAEKAVAGLHNLINIPVSDPGTTWQGYEFSMRPFTVSEDWSGSPLHVWLMLAVLILMLVYRKHFTSSAHGLTLCLVAGYLLFSGYLKWQPWNNRLELIFFLLAAPLFGLILEKIKLQPGLFILGLFLYSLPYLFFNPTKPLTQDWNIFNLPRLEMMIRRDNILAPYINGAFYLRDETSCDRIGMHLANGAWEYPFWNMLVEVNRPERILMHVQVDNESRALEIQAGSVCAILTVSDGNQEEKFRYQGAEYLLEFSEPPVGVYLRQP